MTTKLRTTSSILERPLQFTPTAEQDQAVRVLNNWYHRTKKERVFQLLAPPGRAKTSTALLWLANSGLDPMSVCVAAPTNDLVADLSDQVSCYVATTASLLGYRPKSDGVGSQVLKRDGGLRKLNYKLIIVDEAYNTPTVLISELLNNFDHVRILLIGDPDQLAPIEESNQLDQPTLRQIGPSFLSYNLTENMRATCPQQALLMDDVTQFGYDSPLLEERRTSYYEAVSEFLAFAKANKNDPSTFCAIAYRHVVVNQLSEAVRKHVYGFTPDMPYQPGEFVRVSMVLCPLTGDRLTVTNQIVQVLRQTPGSVLVETDGGARLTLEIDSAGKVAKAKEIAIKSKKPIDWHDYYKLAPQFVTMRPTYGCTAHSVQGRTFTRCLVSVTDLELSRDKSLINVAASRSRELSWFY